MGARESATAANRKPGWFLLYEACESEEASRAHKETAHCRAWREAMAPWLARPREGVAYQVVGSGDRDPC